MKATLTRPALALALFLAVPLALSLLAAAAQAANLQITVLGADGQPAADVAVQLQPGGVWASQPLPEPALIVQKDIRFQPFVTVVPVGSTVRFVNRDRFDHHVRSQPGGPLGNVAPAQQFEFRLAAVKGGREAPAAELVMDKVGIVALGCHLHGSMRGHLLISNTPWVAVTDAKGQATVADVPDGALQLRLWHPEQLVDQPALRLAAGNSAPVQAALNFSPRRRPPPTPPPKGEYTF